MSDHEKFMREAIKEAEKAFAEGEVPIGSAVVVDGKVAARGHNMRRALDDPTAHAEMICLREFGMRDASKITLYSTLEPCPMCAGAIIQTGIPRVVYGEYDLAYGACGSSYDILARTAEHIVAEILREESRSLLLKFFEKELGRPATEWFDIKLPEK